MAQADATIRVGLDATGVQQGQRTIKRSLDDVDASARQTTNLMNGLGAALAALGVGFSLQQAIQQAYDFNKALGAVSTLLSGDIKKQMADITASSREFAKQFGSSATAQAKSYYDIISAGIGDAADAAKLLGVANKLATGGFADLTVVADGLTSALAAYGISADRAGEVADAFFVAAKDGKTTIEELSSNIGKVAPIANAMGVSIDETTAAISALTKGGISTTESVTGLRAILAQVAKPSQEATELAQKLGLQFDVTALQTKGLAGFIKDVAEKTGGSTKAMALLMGGVEATVPALALAGTAGKSFAETLEHMKNKAGETEKANAAMADNISHRMDIMKARVSDALLQIGDYLQHKLVEGFEWLLSNTKVLEGGLAALAAMITMTVVPSVVALTTAMLANPIGLLITAISVAVGALVTFRNHVVEVGDTTVTVANIAAGVWKTLKEGVVSVANAIKEHILAKLDQWIDGYNKLRRAWEELKYRLSDNPIEPIYVSARKVEASLFGSKRESEQLIDKAVTWGAELGGRVANGAKSVGVQLANASGLTENIKREAGNTYTVFNGLERISGMFGSNLKAANDNGIEPIVVSARRVKLELEGANAQLLRADQLASEVSGKGMKDLKTEATLFGDIMKNAVQGIQTNFADFFNNALKGHITSFKSFAGSMLGVWRNMIAQMLAAQTMLALGFGDILLGNAAAGAAGGAAGSAAGGFGSSIMGSAGSNILTGGFGALLQGNAALAGRVGQFAFDMFGPAAGNFATDLTYTLTNPGNLLGGFAGNMLAGSIFGKGTGTNVGSTLGGIAGGMLIPIPILGSAIGSFLGGAVGSLFNSKPSDKTAGFEIDNLLTGATRSTGYGVGHAKYSAENTQAATGFTNTVANFAKNLLGITGGSLNIAGGNSFGIALGSRDGTTVRVGATQRNFETPEDAMKFAVSEIAKGLTGLAPHVQAEFDKIDFSKPFDEVMKALDALSVKLAERQGVVDVLAGIDEELKRMADPQAYDLAQANKYFDAIKEKALEYGLDITKLEEMRAIKIAEIIKQYTPAPGTGSAGVRSSGPGSTSNPGGLPSAGGPNAVNDNLVVVPNYTVDLFRQALADNVRVTEDLIKTNEAQVNSLQSVADGLQTTINRNRLDPNLSPLTPLQRRDEALAQFEAAQAAANVNDPASIQRLADAGNALLTASKAYNASNAAYTADYNRVQSTLEAFKVSALGELNIARQHLSVAQAQLAELQKLANSPAANSAANVQNPIDAAGQAGIVAQYAAAQSASGLSGAAWVNSAQFKVWEGVRDAAIQRIVDPALLIQNLSDARLQKQDAILGNAGANWEAAVLAQMQRLGIPAMANGGIAFGPTLAMIGEGREPEVVGPLSQVRSMIMEGSEGNSQEMRSYRVQSQSETQQIVTAVNRVVGEVAALRRTTETGSRLTGGRRVA